MEYEEEKLTEGLVLARTRAVDLDGVTKLNFWYVFESIVNKWWFKQLKVIYIVIEYCF